MSADFYVVRVLMSPKSVASLCALVSVYMVHCQCVCLCACRCLSVLFRPTLPASVYPCVN